MISSLFSWFRSVRPGETPDCPLELKAVPGLSTVLDTALHRSVETQLTSTITSAHALLAAWLDLKHQSQLVIQYIKQEEYSTCGCRSCDCDKTDIFATSSSSTVPAPSHLGRYESFARACMEASWEAIDRIATDRFAQTANLGPDVSSTTPTTTASSSTATSIPPTATATTFNPSHQVTSLPGGSSGGISITTNTSATSAATESFLASMIESGKHETGRRRHNCVHSSNSNNYHSPYIVSDRDCWESPRLHCFDAVYCDEVAQTCQRLIRHLLRHPHVVFVEMETTKGFEQNHHTHHDNNKNYKQNNKNNDNYIHNHAKSVIKAQFMLKHQVEILLQVLRRDLPVRLLRFRNAMEADAHVLNRLYLIKTKYRIPLRAFLEAHQSVQRAPSLAVVKEYLEPKSIKLSTTTRSSGQELQHVEHDQQQVQRPPQSSAAATAVVKERLQSILETPELVKALTLEKACFEFELEIATMIYPFCELARYLDQKNARINRPCNNGNNDVLSDADWFETQVAITRLKGLLSRKGGGSHDATSTGIRPLLLDLQGVPRDEDVAYRNSYPHNESSSGLQKQQMQVRLNRLIEILKILSRLCQEKRSAPFSIERKGTSSVELDIPASIVAGCKYFDDEMFSCRFLDWYDFVMEQQDLATHEFEKLAGRLRREEMELSLAGASMQSLQVIQQRLELISADRKKRFDILNDVLQDICKTTELGGGGSLLHIRLICPDEDELMILRPTSALGAFGIPLKLAGEPLPIG